jgi:RNA polymerase sigma factor (sigma-70 family)
MDQAEAAYLVNALFEESAVFLVRFAYRRIRSGEAAEDVVQEAFLALYRDLRLGKQIRDPRAWMVGAVRNQICKVARSNARSGEELFPPEKLDLMASQRLTEYEIESMDEAPLLLSVLSPREEEVVLLRLQSLKYREIADQLGIGTKSVCTLLARAIRKLQGMTRAKGLRKQTTPRSRSEVSSALQ